MTGGAMSLRPILVAAWGNPMAGDDAFGPQVTRWLRTRPLPDTQTVDLATKPQALLNHLPGPELLFIVDAAWQEGVPVGTLIDTDWFGPNRPSLVQDVVVSSHGLSISHDIDLAKSLGMLPGCVRLVACTIGSARLGEPMAQAVQQQVGLAAARIAAHALAWRQRLAQGQSDDMAMA